MSPLDNFSFSINDTVYCNLSRNHFPVSTNKSEYREVHNYLKPGRVHLQWVFEKHSPDSEVTISEIAIRNP